MIPPVMRVRLEPVEPPAVATLPELTLQRFNTDYYDISIIGGANVATSFGPDAAAASEQLVIPESNGYSCGTAGAGTVQESLPASDWNLSGHVAEPFVPGGQTPYSYTAQTAATKSSAFYQMISTVKPREAPGCSASSACTTAGYVCGYDSAAVNQGGDSDYQTSCGKPVAWLSASQIWAMNGSASNAAPFHFQGTQPTASSGTIQLNQLFSCTAPTASGYGHRQHGPFPDLRLHELGRFDARRRGGRRTVQRANRRAVHSLFDQQHRGIQHPWTRERPADHRLAEEGLSHLLHVPVR